MRRNIIHFIIIFGFITVLSSNDVKSFEHIEEKEAKRLEREKQEWLKECDKDIIDDSCNGKKEMEDEARQR